MVVQLNQWSELEWLVTFLLLLGVVEFTEFFSYLLNLWIIIVLLDFLSIVLVHTVDSNIVVLHSQSLPGDESPA